MIPTPRIGLLLLLPFLGCDAPSPPTQRSAPANPRPTEHAPPERPYIDPTDATLSTTLMLDVQPATNAAIARWLTRTRDTLGAPDDPAMLRALSIRDTPAPADTRPEDLGALPSPITSLELTLAGADKLRFSATEDHARIWFTSRDPARQRAALTLLREHPDVIITRERLQCVMRIPDLPEGATLAAFREAHPEASVRSRPRALEAVKLDPERGLLWLRAPDAKTLSRWQQWWLQP